MLKPKDYIIGGRKNYKTVIEMVENSCKIFADKVVMQMKEGGVYRKVTYRDFWDNINKVAKGLRHLFFLPKERAAVYSENSPEWGMAYLGISLSGGIIVPIDAQMKPDEILFILDHSKSKFIFTSSKLLDNVLEIFKKAKSLKKIICFDDVEETKDVIKFDELLKKGEKVKFAFLPKIKPNNILSILYTSGTTGVSKGVMLTQKNVISDVELSSQMLYFDENDTFLSVLPLHHSFECTAGFLTPLYKGATITYAESLKSSNILANIKETNVTVMLGVPLLFEKFYNGIKKSISEKSLPVRIAFNSMLFTVKLIRKLTGKKIGKQVFKSLREKAGLESIRFFISGGGPLRPDIAEDFDDLGLTILQGYGLTETSPVVSVSTLEHLNYYSVGLPLPEIEVKIDKPDENGIGEIIVKGDIVMKGYYKNKKETQKVLKNNWLYTGDMGYIDKDGFLYITGRKKNIIVTAGGKNVYPEEIEEKLNSSDFILESLVYGLATSERDRAEKIVALIVPDYEKIENHFKSLNINLTDEKLIELIKNEIKNVNDKLPIYKRISNFKIHPEEFVKTSTRKIKRYLYISEMLNVR